MGRAQIESDGGSGDAFMRGVSVSIERALSSDVHVVQIVWGDVVVSARQTIGARLGTSLFASYTLQRRRLRVRPVDWFKKRLT